MKFKREVETEAEIALRSHGSRLRYECGLARRFFDPELKEHYDERWMQCNWNQTWTKTDTLDSCVWVACLYPPEPPSHANLITDWAGGATETGGNISYKCATDDIFFEWDKDMSEFNVTCLEGNVMQDGSRNTINLFVCSR